MQRSGVVASFSELVVQSAQVSHQHPTSFATLRSISHPRTARAASFYPDCMAALERGVRRDLIGAYIDKAKINWAHIALAQLIDGGYVDRVLTTNFDPLISRACALVNSFPAVYDFAASHTL